MWYLIVSILDLCPLSYFEHEISFKISGPGPIYFMCCLGTHQDVILSKFNIDLRLWENTSKFRITFSQNSTLASLPLRSILTCVIKNSNTQGSSPYVLKDFQYLKELLLYKKKIFRSLWEQILFFKRSSHFEKGRNSLLDTVVSLWCALLFQCFGLASARTFIVAAYHASEFT